MCTRPLTLSTSKLPFDWRTDKGFFTVPCGKCPECLEQKQKEWQARAIAEWIRVRRVGGCCYMYTFTYSNENLPIINGKAAFSRRDVQLFLKRLRKELSRLFGSYKLLKYVITSEYGGTTRRPHYHGLFFFDTDVDYVTVRSLMDSCWRLGFVAPSSQNHGRVVNSAGIVYSLKYINKDQDFTYEYEDKYGNKFVVPIIDEQRSTRHFNAFAPFHLQSQGFGYYLSFLLTEQSLWSGKVSLPVHNGYKDYRIPLYNIRKVLYREEKTINGNVRYVMNERGIQLTLARYDTRKVEKRSQFEQILAYPTETFFLNPVFGELEIYSNSDFRSSVGEITDDFLDYVLVYRGLALNGYAFIPHSPHETLERYLRGFEYPFEPSDKEHKYPNYLTPQILEYENKLFLLTLASAAHSYAGYVERTEAYNTQQKVLYDQKGKKMSLRPILSFDEYYMSSRKISDLHFSQLDARKNAPETINTKRITVYERCFPQESCTSDFARP